MSLIVGHVHFQIMIFNLSSHTVATHFISDYYGWSGFPLQKEKEDPPPIGIGWGVSLPSTFLTASEKLIEAKILHF